MFNSLCIFADELALIRNKLFYIDEKVNSLLVSGGNESEVKAVLAEFKQQREHLILCETKAGMKRRLELAKQILDKDLEILELPHDSEKSKKLRLDGELKILKLEEEFLSSGLFKFIYFLESKSR